MASVKQDGATYIFVVSPCRATAIGGMAILILTLLTLFTLSVALPSPQKQLLEAALASNSKSLLTYDDEFKHSFGHFLNGSYKVHDVLEQLQANKTIGQKYAKK